MNAKKAAGQGEQRARKAAGAAAAGAAIASIGLVGFAAVAAFAGGHLPYPLLLALAASVWVAVSVLLWSIRQRI